MKNKHLFIGPLLALALFFCLDFFGIERAAAITAAITALTAWWWATEALPIYATSLVPFTLFPLCGVISHKTAASGFGSHIILLMLGGFLLAKGLERSGAHERFAHGILRIVGRRSQKRLVLAFMLSAALLSMWVSNTATCLMLIPIALACLQKIDDAELVTPLILSVAYACSIGGIATLIGTPPNIIFAGIYEEAYNREFGFLEWLKIGLPISLLMLPIAWLWLTRGLTKRCEVDFAEQSPWSSDEKRVVTVFLITIFLWVFRSQPFGGWSGAIGVTTVGDATIGLLGALALFIVRSEKGGGLLDWESATKIPWGILLMFGAGITIAKAFFESGLADIIGAGLSGGIAGLPTLAVMLLICASITFFTELNSNLATTTLVLPILAATASATGILPEHLMIPATISASCAFMLPVATAPNAIAYSTDKITLSRMLREGFILNLIFVFVIGISCYLLL